MQGGNKNLLHIIYSPSEIAAEIQTASAYCVYCLSEFLVTMITFLSFVFSHSVNMVQMTNYSIWFVLEIIYSSIHDTLSYTVWYLFVF